MSKEVLGRVRIIEAIGKTNLSNIIKISTLHSKLGSRAIYFILMVV